MKTNLMSAGPRVAALAAALACAWPASAGLGTPVPLTVTERSGTARTNEGVTTGVPIPQSANVLDVRTLMLTSSASGNCSGGATVDSMMHVVERWGGAPGDTTKPIRWVWVETVVPSLAADASVVYCLKDRTGPDPGAAGLTVATSGGYITVDTGAMKFRVSTAAFNFLDQVTVGGTPVVNSSPANTWKVVANGVEYNTSNTDASYRATVEYPAVANDANSAGANIRAQIKLSGKFTAAGGSRKFNYEMRLSAYAGGTSITVRPVIVFSEDMFADANKPSAITLSLPLATANSLQYTFGAEAGAASGAMTSAEDVYLLQYDHGRGASAGLPGYAIVRNGAAAAEGHQAPGWVSAGDGTVGAAVRVRDFWQRYPMELEIDGKTLAVHLWPKHGDAAAGVGDGGGPLSQVFAAKRDRALAAVSDAAPYAALWPYDGGAAMDLTPKSLNANRTIYTVTRGATTAISAALNVADTAEGYCTTQANPSCHIWPAGTSQRVHLKRFTGCWSVLNGFHTATFSGVFSGAFPVVTIDADTSACGLPATPALNQGTSADPVISNIDNMTDMQAHGMAEEWEIQYQFFAGAAFNASDAAAAMADRLMLVNPSWLASSQAFGRIKEVDTAEFPLAEANIGKGWNAFTAGLDWMNLYGAIHYGDYYYDPASPPAGIGNRMFAFSRKGWQLVPWMMYARTGDPQYMGYGIAVTTHGIDVDLQHVTTSGDDVNGNHYAKHTGSGPCTHGPTHWYPTYETYSGAGGGYICTEGQQPQLDYVVEAAEAMYVLTAHDRSREVVLNEMYPWAVDADAATNNIMETIAGRSFGGCMQIATTVYRLSGNGLDYAEKCFRGIVRHNDGTAAIGNPVGMAQGTRYGNDVDWGYFAASWSQRSFAEFADIDPNYCATDAQGTSHCVRAEFLRYAKAHTGMGVTPDTTGQFYYTFQGKTPAYAYAYTGDDEYLKTLQRIFTQFLQPLGPIVGTGAIGGGGMMDVHYWANYMLEMPFAMAALSGRSIPPPDNPPLQVRIPADGNTVDFVALKQSDQEWTGTFSIDTGLTFGGDYFNVAGAVTFDVYDPDGVRVLHDVRSACVYGGPAPCIPNSWYPIESSTATPGHGMSITYGGRDNRVQTIRIPADGKTGEYTIKVSAVNTPNQPGDCNGEALDRFTCHTTLHYLFAYGTSLKSLTLVTPSVAMVDCPPAPYRTPHLGRGLYYFKTANGAAQIQASMSRGNYFLLSPAGQIFPWGSTTTTAPQPGMWALVSDSQLDDGATGYCISLKGVKPLTSASPQTYYDSPRQTVSQTLQNYGGAITVNFSGTLSISLTAAPAALDFRCTAGGYQPLAQTLRIGASAAIDNWTAAAHAGWLSDAPRSAGAAGPTQVAVDCSGLAAGSYTDLIHVSSATTGVVNAVDVPVTLTVLPPVAVATAALPRGNVGRPYAAALSASGGQPAYTWSLAGGAMCAGLALSPGGLVSGTPAGLETCTFTARVEDAGGTAAVRQLTLSVSGAPSTAVSGATAVSAGNGR